MSEDLQRLPIGFPRDVHEALRREAFEQHTTMSAIVVEATRGKLGMVGPVFDVHLHPTDVAVVNLPEGTAVRVHCGGSIREHRPSADRMVAMIPGDPDLLGWSVPFYGVGSLSGVRNNKHRRDRAVWHEAAKLATNGDVVYVEHEQRDWYGRQIWIAARVRLAT